MTVLEVRQLGVALGAEIRGADLSQPLDATAVECIRSAFLEHIVLVIRGQSLSPAAQIAFTELFGAVEPHPLASRRGLPDFPQLMVLENRPGKPGARNDFWHSDISHAECPPAVSLLHALEVPEGRGDTMFCSMYAAYEQLSSGMQRFLEKLQALHSGEATARRNREEPSDALPILEVPPPLSHPVVRTHPETGRKALYVNPFFTQCFSDMSEPESAPILNYLHELATRPENVYRHRWQKGDVLFWDNRCAMHYAVKDYDEHMPRLMHRTTAAGDRPF
jgi:taurine dioxygenase